MKRKSELYKRLSSLAERGDKAAETTLKIVDGVFEELLMEVKEDISNKTLNFHSGPDDNDPCLIIKISELNRIIDKKLKEMGVR